VIGGFTNCLKRGTQDCNPTRNPGGAFCCLQESSTCSQNDNVVMVSASSYDQTCKTNADCVAIGEGNACAGWSLHCSNAAISKIAQSQYQSDLSKIGPTTDPTTICFCPAAFGPCCISGKCHADPSCSTSQ